MLKEVKRSAGLVDDVILLTGNMSYLCETGREVTQDGGKKI